jgi:hypothetical protein
MPDYSEQLERCDVKSPKLWYPMVEGLGRFFTRVEKGDYLTIQTIMERFGHQPENSPYFQICRQEDDSVSVEISGNSQLSPELTESEYQEMSSLGWELPRKGKDEDYGDLPNFVKTFGVKPATVFIADEVAYALVNVFGMKPTDLLEMESEWDAAWMGTYKCLERLEQDPVTFDCRQFRLKGEFQVCN